MNEVMERKIVTVLLDKYERSSFFRTDTTPTKRILLRLYENGKSEFLDYNIENSEQRIRINESVQALAQNGLIRYEWMKGEERHIVSKVWLNIENLQQAYSFVHRQPQRDFLASVENELIECMDCVQSKAHISSGDFRCVWRTTVVSLGGYRLRRLQHACTVTS